MSGVAIIRARLVANAALIAVVPATNIRAGEVPLRSSLPWISIEQTGLEEHKNIEMTGALMQMERVEVNILSATFPVQKIIERLVEAACQTFRGTVGAFSVDSILPDGKTADGNIPGVDCFVKEINYMVRFYE